MLGAKPAIELADDTAPGRAGGRTGRRDLPCSAFEWRIARSRILAYLFDTVIHRPRLRFHTWKWKQRQTAGMLSHFEAKRFSQYGEDGIIGEIFARIGEGNKFFVEFGIGDGSECCTRNLAVNRGWDGVLIEGSESDVVSAQRLFASFAGVKVVRSFITAENILRLLESQGVPREPDLLVIDIDGNDYWIWERILSAYRPRAVVIEYNGRWLPPVEWIMPYDAEHRWRRCAYFGASLTSLEKLGARHGYSLVGCSSTGVNAFFVRNNEVGDRFVEHTRGASYHYAPPLYGQSFGHPLHART